MHLRVTALILLVALSSSAQNTCPDQQTSQQVDARIDHLISQMTLVEKIAQLGDQAPAIPRLGIPGYNWWNEGLHGIARTGMATVFPQAIGLAATWDADLMHAIGDTVSTEARAKFNPRAKQDSPRYGGLTVWSPNINIFRDPRWGRGQETYGEDPFLTATMGTQFVEGVQGADKFYRKAIATPKHFAVHSGPETGRDGFNSVVSEHDLADTYLPAFHALAATAGAGSMMCSYNAINGVPACANDMLLNQTARARWGFNGYVVSDCDAVGNISKFQHYADDAAHGAAAALNAGVDLDCGRSYASLQQAYDQKLVTEATINRALHRLLLARLRLGMLDAADCGPYNKIAASENDTAAHRALALRAAEESAVLLRNNGILPLKPTQSIAIVGPTADMLQILEANYHGTASHPVTPLDGLRAGFRTVHYAQGSLLAAGVTAPIPRSALRVSSGANAAEGLKAEYFSTASFDGAPAITKTVGTVDVDLQRAAPDASLSATNYAIRWSGFLIPPAAGDYVLRANVSGGMRDQARLLIDDKVVFDNQDRTAARASQGRITLHLNDTAPHALRMELTHTGESGDNAAASLQWEPPAEALLTEAVDAARKSDVIVASVGLSPELEGEALRIQLPGFAGGDRVSLDLPASQRTLLSRLQDLHKPMVVVLTSGSAVALGPEQAIAGAIVAAWYPGEEGGNAISNLLLGKANFSGRLPVTFYRAAEDLPQFTDYSMARRTYRYFDGPVLYPFGFGLSYAKFSYSPVKLSATSVTAGSPLQATVTLKNTSAVAGTEVAELYLVPPPTPGAPRLALKGIQRIALRAGESKQVSFSLTPEQMSFVDAAGKRAVRAGSYKLFIGGTQPALDSNAATPFQITGETPATSF